MFSIVTPVYNTPTEPLIEMIESVRQQSYEDWELILVDDCSPDPRVREILHEAARGDARIRVVERAENGHIVKASNDGVAAASGEFVVLLDHDDLLTPNALAANARAIAETPDADVLYSDEDRLLPNGRRSFHFSKPDWSPWRLRSQNYLNHLTVLRTSLVREVGGFREGFEGSQDHDLFLRVTERARRVVHIPEVLYHWRIIPGSVADRLDAKPYATYAAMRAIAEHLRRLDIDGKVIQVRPGLYEIAARLSAPDVALVVVLAGETGQDAEEARQAIRNALADARREIGEIVVVHPAGMSPALLEGDRPLHPRPTYVARSAGETVVRATLRAIADTHGAYVVVLDGRVAPAHPHWLAALLTPLVREEVGVVGGLVVAETRGVASAGLAERGGRWRHALRGFHGNSEGSFGDLRLIREVDAVDGSCLALRRSDIADLVAGLDGAQPTDIGLALSAAAHATDKTVVWTGHSRFYSSDYPRQDLSSPPPAAPGEGRFPVVEDIRDGWIPVVDRSVRLHAPALLPAWQGFKQARRKTRRRVRRTKRRLRRRLRSTRGRLGRLRRRLRGRL